MKDIGIFPASGGLGGSTYRHLLKLVPNDHVTLICRHPEKVEEEYRQAGVAVRRASYECTPQELEVAFSGLDVLFLVSYPSHVHEYRVKVQLPAIDAARRAGVKHIFYSSLGFAGDASSGLPSSKSQAVVMQAHLSSEKYLSSLAQSDPGFTYTSIREGLYSESYPIYTAFLDPKNAPDGAEVTIPHDGSGPGVTWVKRDELGEGSAKLIAKYCGVGGQFPQQLVNGTVLLSGTTEISLAETVGVLGRAVGKSFKIREVPVDEYVKLPQVVKQFGDEEKARTWATAWVAIRAGETSLATKDLEQLLGRKPEEYEKTIQALLA
ncbi:NAD(P)-binding protein [Cryphonectria parasitica EP155]|uniref:NAD(P)-binding protein n=1 Tax=Cryphonectria parasitica (strain ATCC 38755 / EP155) TaxID=660469 RepID=A0A9P4Y2L7_CRYP1|nr:NAD(P)-binding protein [Cryphonectria parasitica EP155]KAF3765222.1 NAD(P)-binding protein [Cryphonectria parasitica EP155]